MSVNHREIYVALVGEGVTFDPDVHCRLDFNVSDVIVKKNDENSFWTADIVIEAVDANWRGDKTKKRVIISERDQDTGEFFHVLTGRVEKWPVGRIGDKVTVNVTAAPPTVNFSNANDGIVKRQDLEDQALAGVDDDPWRFFTNTPIGQRRKPEERLSSRYAKLNWGRTDHNAPVLTDLLYGNGYLDLGENFFEGSLSYESSDTKPIGRVRVTLSAEFEQQVFQYLDLGQALYDRNQAVMFGPGSFASLTPASKLGKNVGEKIGDWTVYQANMQRVAPFNSWTRPYIMATRTNFNTEPKKAAKKQSELATADVDVSFINGRPVFTPKESFDEESSLGNSYYKEFSKQKSFQRHFYNINYKVCSIATAKRKEVLHFIVDWAGQDTAGYDAAEESLNLSVSNLDGFVDYPEWQAGIHYASGANVKIDGAQWECVTEHTAPSNFYESLTYWVPVVLDVYDPVGGPGVPTFFSRPARLSSTLANGNQKVILQDPAPGYQAIMYAWRNARAKMLDSRREYVSFEAPWSYVRTLTGSEIVRIADPYAIEGGEIRGKVVSISCSLVTQEATLKIASIPGNGGSYFIPEIPVYNIPGIPGGYVIDATLVNAAGNVESMLDEYSSSLNYSVFVNNLNAKNKTLRVHANNTKQLDIKSSASIDANGNVQNFSGTASTPDITATVEAMHATMDFQLSPVAKNVKFEINHNMGVFYIDTPAMIDIGD
jgi:hypothetical protein